MTLALEDVSVIVGERRLLSGVSLGLEPGCFTAVVGPNGAGKSTALRVLAGDLAPDRGSVTLDGRPLFDYPLEALAHRRVVVPQSSRPVFGFRVDDYVALGRLPFGEPTSSPTLWSNVRVAMRMAGCEPLCERDVTTLSGGEYQRVQFARALAQLRGHGNEGETRFLLLDEPTSALDLQHQVSLLGVARDIAHSGVAVLAVLHDLNLAMHFADRVVVLADGCVVTDDTPEVALASETVECVWGQPVSLITLPGVLRPTLVCHYQGPDRLPEVTPRPVIPRAQVLRDVDDAIAHAT